MRIVPSGKQRLINLWFEGKMALKINSTYRDGRGHLHTIGGFTKDHPAWVWTIQGDWYRQMDGRYITYKSRTYMVRGQNETHWSFEANEFKTALDLIEEVPMCEGCGAEINRDYGKCRICS